MNMLLLILLISQALAMKTEFCIFYFETADYMNTPMRLNPFTAV